MIITFRKTVLLYNSGLFVLSEEKRRETIELAPEKTVELAAFCLKNR